MKRLLMGGVIALAVLSIGAGAASASTPRAAVSQRDTASTKAFIALQERYTVGVIRLAPAITVAERAFVAKTRAGCPGVLARLPNKLSDRQVAAVRKFLYESAVAFVIDLSAPLRRLVGRVAEQQQRLRFSDPALQWQVRVTGAATAAYFALRPPNLCTDGRSLVSSMFTRITPAGTRFVRDARTLDQSAAISASSLVRRMRSYAPAAAVTALKRLLGLHRTLDQKLAPGRHLRAVLAALGLKDRPISFAAPGVTS